MSLEIEGLLEKVTSTSHPTCLVLMETLFYIFQLRNINEALNECVSGMAAVSGGSSTVSHTLQRHNDILQDYAQEFNRTKVLCVWVL